MAAARRCFILSISYEKIEYNCGRIPMKLRSARIRRFCFTEVVVPAKSGAINHPDLFRPLHKLPVAGRDGWNLQFDELPKLLVELELDTGVVGLGEFYRGHSWATVEAVARRLVATPLSDIVLQQVPVARCREHDGFELAIWDAFAKSHHLRLCDLLGGAVRSEVKVGAWTGHRKPEEIGPMAADFAARGFDCWKFKCDLEDDVVGWCRAVADAAPGMSVILDPNERWEQPNEAKKRLRALSEVGNLLCLEDPLPRWMLSEYEALRRMGLGAIALHVSLPYVEHGQRVHDAIRALQCHAVDAFNFNGGLAGFSQLAGIAHAAGLPCWHGSEVDLGILEAMYVHQAAAAPACTWPSDIFGQMVREHDLLVAPLRIAPPYVHLPEGIGLGVELNRDAISKYQTKVKVVE
jgi:muconate cycloisomerase